VSGVATILGQGILMNWYYWKRLGLNIPRFWKSILKILWVPLVLCVVTLFLRRFIDFTNIIVFLAGVAVYTAVYCVLLWFFVLNPAEEEQLLGAVKQKMFKK
jgi:O-antigen/teichoic acid export membrane protein